MRQLLCLLLSVAPLSARENHFSTLTPGHPRIILTDQRIGELKSLVETDPLAKRWHEHLLGEGTKILSSPVEIYSLENKKLLNEARSVLKRVSTLSALHRISPDDRFLNRAKKELFSAAEFPDWNPASFLSTAEMTLAFAIGYDWLHHDLTDAEKATLRTAIVEKGLKPGIDVYQRNRGWHNVTHNWNTVCNNGLIAGALAVAGTDPEIAGSILSSAKASLPKGYRDYAPDGGWPEGPGYWGYGTTYAVYGLSALESALGTDWDLPRSPGFSDTGNFRIDLIGPSGAYFNFADGGSRPAPSSCMFWLAKKFDRPDYDASERLVTGERPSIFHLIFFNEKFSTPAAAEALARRPISRHFVGTGVAVLQSGPEENPTWLAIKGGSNKVNHSHLDLGTFVLDVGNQRFAEELGADRYTLPGYFGNRRWTYYRLRTEGQNTLVLDGGNQSPSASAEITAFSPTSTTIDLSAAYPDGKKILRTASVAADGSSTIDDQITLNQPAEILWAFHTRAKTTTAGRTATLVRNGTTLKAELISPADATFKVIPVNIAPPQRPDSNLRKLSVQLPEKTAATRITIRFTPL